MYRRLQVNFFEVFWVRQSRSWKQAKRVEMITKSQHFDEMTSWVSHRKAAVISGLNRTTIFKNAMRGRLPIRVRDGHIYVYEPSVRDFRGAPIGNPTRVAAADNGLGPTLVKAFKTLREEIEASHEDVVYEIDLLADPTLVRITVFEPSGSRTLKPRRLSPK